MDSALMNVKELAVLLGVAVRTTWRLRSAGKLPSPIRIGKSVRWSAKTIGAWIDMGCPDQETFEATLRNQQKETER